VGNGAPSCHWVRDNISAYVAVIGPDPNGKILVLVSVEVYMLFMNDLQEYYAMVQELVGDEVYQTLYFVVQGQHNHEGPDTSGLSARPINHDYYKYMLEIMAQTTQTALNNMETAYLFYGQEEFYYGLGDIRDPLMQDSTLRILRAYRNQERSGTPIFTVVNWGMHPEVTLGYEPIINQQDCLKLNPPQPNCNGEGKYFTHDYPGHFSNVMKQLQGGGEALYFNGAIGCQIGIHAPVWEVTPEYPLGNGSVVPPGATIVPENFRMAYLIGEQLAIFANNIPLANANSPIVWGEFQYQRASILARVTNFFFRFGLVPQTALNPGGNPDRPLRIGNSLRPAYVCQGNNPKITDCVMDDFQYLYDPTVKLPYRVGNWMETEAKFIKLGPIRFLTIPGELAPELSTGLPRDFDFPSSVSKYYDEPELHVTGAAYTMPGVAMTMIGDCSPESPCWIFGLTQDEIGYMFPISDWKIKCTADDCLALYEKGALSYPDSASGYQCKNITEKPSAAYDYYLNNWDLDTWTKVNNTCVFGQMYGQVDDHYEEVCMRFIVVLHNIV
jgi:hypothetical protein